MSDTNILRNSIVDFCQEHADDILLMDGFDEAFIGVGARINLPPVAIYNRMKMVKILVTRDGMTYDEADEYISYNCEGAWVGDTTPIIVNSF